MFIVIEREHGYYIDNEYRFEDEFDARYFAEARHELFPSCTYTMIEYDEDDYEIGFTLLHEGDDIGEETTACFRQSDYI